jgi:hypothetical protein
MYARMTYVTWRTALFDEDEERRKRAFKIFKVLMSRGWLKKPGKPPFSGE